jgi:hypothetical protein
MDIMIKGAVLGFCFAAAVSTAAGAQAYYPYYPAQYPYYAAGYGYPVYGYPYGFPYYGGYYPYYRPAPAYSDPYVALRPYSDSAGPPASGHTGY